MVKKILLLLISFHLLNLPVFAQKTGENSPLPSKIYTSVKNSPLAQGTWYKFAIDTTGVFKLDRKFLQDLGINTADLDPRNIRIFGNGGALLPQLNSDFRYDGLQENAIFVEGENDGRFDENDYILFYGRGPGSWKVDPADQTATRYINNIYSDKAYYFISADNGPGKRIAASPEIASPANYQVSTFKDYRVNEVDRYNLFANGQQWFGTDLSLNNTTTSTFHFDNLESGGSVFIRVRGVAISSTASQINIQVNGADFTSINFPAIPSGTGNLTLAIPGEVSGSLSVSTSPITVQVSYNNNGNPSARAYLDYIEVVATQNLKMDSKQFTFRSFVAANQPDGSIVEYLIQNGAPATHLWNVTDPLNPAEITNESSDGNYVFKATGGSLQEFVITTGADYYTPEILKISKIDNQNLHSLYDIDYLIVTRDFLMSEAERLAAYHRQHSGLNVRVVNLEQVYNEFASGSSDLTAIRDFVRNLYFNASTEEHRIKYLCLFGDSSYDFKDRLSNNNNIVPAFQSYESFDLARSYVTDDYYGMMDVNEGDLNTSDKQDVATGRFPVSTLAQAKSTVDKTLNYYATQAFGDWRNRITLVADDPDAANEFVLQQTVERIADTISKAKPIFNLTKIYADAYVQETSAGGERYPDVNEAIDNAVETGTLILNYFGHGGEDGWAGERILEVPQIEAWYNPNTLPLFITITCEFSRFDNPLRPTAGEYVFLNPNGGAVGMITTTREIFISVGERYNEILIKKLLNFSGENYTMAQALMQMKNDPSAPSSSQRLFVYFLGDPAMKMALPQPNIKITRLNDKDILQSADTLKALSKIKLEGFVTDADNNILPDFNGIISTTVFDKSIDKVTLDNNNFGNTMTFDAIESKIFRGRASVINGQFSHSFIVPKDIRIAYGKAKISMYADNTAIDKNGVNQEITIGGIDENAPEDTTGPTIQMFMDDESFVDGGNTSESPHLLAILQDDSGINTSITAVDHDIVAILDDDQANPYILNDFYETDLDDFTKGKVKFPFRNLEPGPHTLHFKCWDTYNNPAESTLNFVVVNDKDLVLSKVLNYPNPFINYTEFWFNHNKPNEPLEVQVQIFTVSGKLVKTINQTVQSENLSREITWNGLDDFGNKIGKGVYVYKLSVRSILTNTKAEKFEKLVILQ
ncbi:MAG: type IX secretion system sortase PorU [Flavobacteriaceae bacterium]|nr:type IX secretion system sortase PorU [Flavobacteriaceae bacterium]